MPSKLPRLKPSDYKAELAKPKGTASSVSREAPIDVKCPECGSPMKLRTGKWGDFYGCTNFPDCRKTLKPEKVNQSLPASTSNRSKPLTEVRIDHVAEILKSVGNLTDKQRESLFYKISLEFCLACGREECRCVYPTLPVQGPPVES